MRKLAGFPARTAPQAGQGSLLRPTLWGRLRRDDIARRLEQLQRAVDRLYDDLARPLRPRLAVGAHEIARQPRRRERRVDIVARLRYEILELRDSRP